VAAFSRCAAVDCVVEFAGFADEGEAIVRVVRLVLLIALAVSAWGAAAELRLCLRNDPKTFDPLLVDEESGEMIRYLTGGVLIRVNRVTQKLEPELAVKWKLSPDGRTITFALREGVRFSDGTPFTAADVAATVQRFMDPAVHSPMGDTFRAADGPVNVKAAGSTVTIVFPAAVAGVERLFDQVAISPAKPANREKAVLGPFMLGEYKPGDHIVLARNPNYWRRDESGRALPYLASIRFDIQGNRDIEMLRFRRGEIHMISSLDAAAFEQLQSERPGAALDAGASFDNEMLWFNQVKSAPLPEYKKAWFQSTAFRRAISGAINRDDIVRLVYKGHAQPAVGPFSAANRLWFNGKLKAHSYSPAESLKMLESAGFRRNAGKLYDKTNKPVEFSVVTNSGNKSRARIASLVQQDLAKIGIQLNVVTLDFPALIERISRTQQYEMCLLGLVNVDPDPNGQMNVWLSSAANHQWNPRQKSPETPWEAEIDRLMRLQAGSPSYEKRRASFNRVQEIVSEQVPFIYLVTKNALVAVDPRLKNLAPGPLTPQLLWNAHQLNFQETSVASR
jgi:peptide/nickel transport system substrate-binding protein